MVLKPILFVDFDRTICFDKYWRSLPPAQFEIVQQLLFGEDKTLLNEWMRGLYTAEEINKVVAEKIDVPFEELWRLFVKDCQTMQASSEVLKKLQELRSTYIVVLITGNMDSFTRFTVPALKLGAIFDHINNSFFDKRFKNDNEGAIFVEYAKILNVPFSGCVLLDDSAATCKIFETLGGTAYHITPTHDVMSYLTTLG